MTAAEGWPGGCPIPTQISEKEAAHAGGQGTEWSFQEPRPLHRLRSQPWLRRKGVEPGKARGPQAYGQGPLDTGLGAQLPVKTTGHLPSVPCPGLFSTSPSLPLAFSPSARLSVPLGVTATQGAEVKALSRKGIALIELCLCRALGLHAGGYDCLSPWQDTAEGRAPSRSVPAPPHAKGPGSDIGAPGRTPSDLRGKGQGQGGARIGTERGHKGQHRTGGGEGHPAGEGSQGLGTCFF